MKKIYYQYCVKANCGTEENLNYVDTFVDKILNCHTDEEFEKSLLVAQQEAYQGKYDIEEIYEHIPTASRNITSGECFTIDGVFYKAAANIPTGENLVVGQNVIVTTIEQQLYELKGE